MIIYLFRKKLDRIREKTKKNIKYVKPKYPFELWGYCNKIEVVNSEQMAFQYETFEKYIGFTNNACESINSYIKSLIPINQKISLSYFCNIVSKLFLKFENKRMHNELNDERPIIIKRLLTDN